MPACTFFGHRECPAEIREKLRQRIIKLIEQGVDTFYVGQQGQFDGCVHSLLKQLSEDYPRIFCHSVLAYLPIEKGDFGDYSDTIFPEGLETVPPKFAIVRRNKWMIDNAEYCVCYIHHTWGGAYQFAAQAKRKGLTVINLGPMEL